MDKETKLSSWIELAEGLYDFLNRRNTTINYSFQDLDVFVPQATGENPERAKWTIDGTVSLSTVSYTHLTLPTKA